MRTVVFDTSVLYAVINEDDEHHKKAVSIAEKVERIILPSIVLHELEWILRRSLDTETVRSILLDIISSENVSIECNTDKDIGFAVTTMKNARDYNDLLILAVAVRQGVPLISFDDELARRYGDIWEIRAVLE